MKGFNARTGEWNCIKKSLEVQPGRQEDSCQQGRYGKIDFGIFDSDRISRFRALGEYESENKGSAKMWRETRDGCSPGHSKPMRVGGVGVEKLGVGPLSVCNRARLPQ
jgi:hypothetical protein